MLDRIIENARQEEIFSREDTPTEQRVMAAFLYHAGLSYRTVERVIERSYGAVHDWYHRLAHLFAPDRDKRPVVVVDETKLEVDGEEVFVWAAIDVDTFEVIHVEVSAGRSSLDALTFLQTVLERCRGQPVIKTDRGPWYNCRPPSFDCEHEHETVGDRSLVEAWFGLLKYRTMLFWHRFPHRSDLQSTDEWTKAFAAIHNALLQT
ncbi:MAG: DDE-type integrase/transposase/recombinase [Halobacteriaceae archaeon]